MAAFAKTLQKNNAAALTDVEVLASPDKAAVPAPSDFTGSADVEPTVDTVTEEVTSMSLGTPDQEDRLETPHRIADEL